MIDPLRTGGRLLDVAMLVAPFPLCAAGYAQTSGRPWAPAAYVTVSALALVLALWAATDMLNPVYAPDHRSRGRLVLRVLSTLVLIAVALLNLPGLQNVRADAWALSFGVTLALISAARVGWRALSFGQHWIPQAIRRVEPAAGRAGRWPLQVALDQRPRELPVRPPRPAPPSAAAKRAATTAAAFQAIRSGMDEMTYAAGDPNVLTITKFVQRDGEDGSDGLHARHRLGAPAAALATEPSRRAASGSFRRADRDGETVLALAEVLDVVTVSELQPLVEEVVAERCRSIALDAGALRTIDSTGVAAIVGLVKRARAFGGTVRVTGLKDQPLEVFRLLRLDLLFALPGGAPPHASS